VGFSEEEIKYYNEELVNRVIPNVHKLQTACRANRVEVLHTRIQSMTLDGRDRSLFHKQLGIHVLPGTLFWVNLGFFACWSSPIGSPLAQFPKLVAPKRDEIVLNKTSSGVFNSTNISYILNNLGIIKLYVCGGFTNECVLSAVRNAYESNIEVTLVHDACLSTSEEDHLAAIRTLRRYSRVADTETALKEFEQENLPNAGSR
jgi:nicotinamidase-related amidase